MLNRMSEFLAKELIIKCKLDESKVPIYKYGFEVFLSSFFIVATICLLSAMFSSLAYVIIFFMVFVPLRMFSGGYHAATYRGCYIISNLIYWVVYFLSKIISIINIPHRNVLLWVLLVASSIIIFLFGPVENPHHPISEERHIKNRHILRITVASVFVVGAAILWLNSNWIYLPIFVVTVTTTAVLMIIPKIKERRS